MVGICLRYCHTRFSKLVVPCYLTTSSVSEFVSSDSLQSASYGQSLKFPYPNEYSVISHCNFNLYSLAINDVEHLHLLFCFLYIFFGKISVHIFFPLNNWIIFPPIIHSILYSECKSFVRYLFCIYFSQSVTYLSFFKHGLLKKQTFKILIKSNLSTFLCSLSFCILFK